MKRHLSLSPEAERPSVTTLRETAGECMDEEAIDQKLRQHFEDRVYHFDVTSIYGTDPERPTGEIELLIGGLLVSYTGLRRVTTLRWQEGGRRLAAVNNEPELMACFSVFDSSELPEARDVMNVSSGLLIPEAGVSLDQPLGISSLSDAVEEAKYRHGDASPPALRLVK